MKATTLLLLSLTAMLPACNYESFEDRCAREAREYTEKQCPRRMDPFTTMDSIVYHHNTRTVSYYYTLEGLMDTNLSFKEKLKNELTSLLIKNVTNSTDLKPHKESKMNFDYKYFSQTTGELLLDVLVTPEMYEAKVASHSE